MVMVMVVMMIVSARPETRSYHDAGAVPSVIAVMVMMVMMVVLYKELSRLHPWGAFRFINGPQLFHGIRNRLKKVRIRTGPSSFGRVGWFVVACAIANRCQAHLPRPVILRSFYPS